MSRVNLSISNKGINLIDSSQAWVKTTKGKNRYKLNPKYRFVGRIDSRLPNIIITASDNVQPTFKGDVNNLNKGAKNSLVKHFFNSKGKRNKKHVAYLVVKK